MDTTHNPSIEIARDGGTVLLIARDGECGGTAYPLSPAEADAFGRELLAAARDADGDPRSRSSSALLEVDKARNDGDPESVTDPLGSSGPYWAKRFHTDSDTMTPVFEDEEDGADSTTE